MRLSARLLKIASKLDRPGYPWYVRVLDWCAGRLAERGV